MLFASLYKGEISKEYGELSDDNKRLLDFANGRYSKVLQKQLMPAASAVNSEDTVDDGEGSFTVMKHSVMLHTL